MENFRLHLKSVTAAADPSSSQPAGRPAASDELEAAKTRNASGPSSSSCSIAITRVGSTANDASLSFGHNDHDAIYNDPLWFTTAIEPTDIDDGISKFFDADDGLLGDIASQDGNLSFNLLDPNIPLSEDWHWSDMSELLGPNDIASKDEAVRSNTRDRHCNICDKEFKFPKDYRRHVASVHNNERPLKCPVDRCKYHHKGFAREDNRKRHVEKMHPGITSLATFTIEL